MSGGFLDDDFAHDRPDGATDRSINDLLFVSFNSRVIALDRDTGKQLWYWKSPKGRSNYVCILVDEDQLFVSIDGYTYCLDPFSGQQIWFNPLKGFGYGIPTLATATSHTSDAAAAEILTREQRRRDQGAN